MKNGITTFFAILFLSFWFSPAQAAFPVRPNQPTEKTTIKTTAHALTTLLFKNPPASGTEKAAQKGNTLGLLSFIFGIGGLLALMLGPLAVLSPLLGIAALILGAISLNNPYEQWMSITGFILGILNILIWLIVLVVILAIISAFK